MHAYSIGLWKDSPEPQIGEDGYETNYCGSYDVPCPDGDPRVADLAAAGCGRFLDELGEPRRAFFFADELSEMLCEAERRTECYAVESPLEVAAVRER
jgi:hypothetical protein